MTGPGVSITPLPAPPLPAGRPNLVFTGFMGTGKTTAGKEAAAELGLPFVDVDDLIERRAGSPVATIFARDGEDAFRAHERRAIEDVARLSATVVATGGGAVLHDEAFDALKRTGEVVVLTATPSALVARLRGGRGRPLLRRDGPRASGDAGADGIAGADAGAALEARLEALLEERAARYLAAGQPLDTSRAIRRAASRAGVERYRASAGPHADAARIAVALPAPAAAYQVLIGRDALRHLPRELCSALPALSRAVVVREAAVDASAGAAVDAALVGAGISTIPVTVAGGEPGKRLGTVTALWDAFRDAGVTRTDAVVVVGGGATLDTIGFAAATYARGVPLVNVPTTLLAMVDASIGGKVAIDHGGTKNLVGAFHHPSLVVIDAAMLDSLPRPLIRHGLAEAIKEAVLASPAMLDLLDVAPLDGAGLPRHLDWVVEQAVRIKAAYVAADPRDGGLRHSLNLGHTFAHAIESATGYGVPHGEAVAVGVVAAARLGEREGVTPPGSAARIRATFERLGLPVDLPAGVDAGAMVTAVSSDKKRRGDRAVFVVPAPGGAALIEGLDPTDALTILQPREAAAR